MSNESVKPVRYAFDCVKCFRSLQIEERIYKKCYEGHTLCLSCRPVIKEWIETEIDWEDRCRELVHENDELMAEIEKLKWICKRSSDFIDAMVGFTGSNMQVYGWHLNDSPEPFDNFVEENLEENLVTDLKTALEELK